MTETAKRIAMWSGPRNISTAMMRAFENRADTQVIDEPYYAHYLVQTGLDHPGRETVLAAQTCDEQEVKASLLAPLQPGKSIFYQKHMSHHLMIGMDQSWLQHVSNAFLIREPIATLASYVKTREEVTLADLGIPQQLALFDFVADKKGTAPPVLDSKDVLKNPKGKLKLLCAALDIPFDEAMLNWPVGKRDTDGAWAPWWYADVEASNGFAPYKYKEPALESHLLEIAELAQPFYEKLARYRL